ncbi:hypothetical protein [Halalkalicoccus tibetensis]|uniref:Rpa-associated protein n=1 Tax=Halalkalicoccus tibetensis TaxID=175632 RepID=A0ABD5V6L0_9EURY
MSSNDGENGSGGDSGPGRREVAHRLFATEFDAASLEYADSDEERAPKYVITPTGARVNRLFVVGVLTEVERVNDEVVRARVVDPTGAFVVYAGQYQTDALAFLERADPPMFVAVTGKANTFRPEDSDRVYTSVRPESVAEVDAETRDRWTVQAAEHTLRRVSEFAAALEGDESDPASGIALAREEYGTTPAYLSALRDTALDAARLVAGEVEEVSSPGIAPGEDDGRAVDLTDLRERDAETPEPIAGEEADADATIDADETVDMADTSGSSESTPSAEPSSAEPDVGAEAGAETEAESAAEPSAETGDSGTAEAEAEDQPRGEQTSPESSGSEPDEASGTIDTTEAVDTTTAEPESEPESGSDDLGDFDAGGSEPSEPEPEGEATADAVASGKGEMYEFDPEERAEIEAEFDMDFSSGNEVDDAGEADIDVPEPDESEAASEEVDTAASEAAEAEAGSGSEDEAADPVANEPESELEPDAESEPDSAGEADAEEDVDVEDRAMAVMAELADGDGADREEVIERVASEAGVAPEEVDDAIESALLSGRCYEPQDDVLKPI